MQLKCPSCGKEATNGGDFFMCLSCGQTTSNVFIPEPQLSQEKKNELLLQVWFNRILNYKTPLGEHATFRFDQKTELWSVTTPNLSFPFNNLKEPSSGIDLLVSASEVSVSGPVIQSMYKTVESLNQEEEDPTSAEAQERYLKRLDFINQWQKNVEAARQLSEPDFH